MRRLAPVLVFTLLIAACGDDDSGTTTQPSESTATSSTTGADGTTTTTAGTTVATSPAPDQCLNLWPEETVQQVTGTGFEFFDQNADGSACTYTALPDSIALAWRVDDLAGFETSRAGAEFTATVADARVCDIGFVTVIEGAVLIMEGYSASQGRTYTATISGFDLEDAEDWAAALLDSVC